MPVTGVLSELNSGGRVPCGNGHEMMRWLAVSQFRSRSVSEPDAARLCQVMTFRPTVG